MQQPKKIVRTTRITGQTIHQEQTTHIVRRVQRKSPQQQNFQKSKSSQSKQKSEYSFQLSKSSDASSLAKNAQNILKRESLEIMLPQQYSHMQRQLHELKKIQLSQHFRQILIKLQRYDANFLKQSQRLLKGILEGQLRRLQKIKNQQKQMRIKYYDTQLLVTCLFYHQKLTSDMSRVNLQLQQTRKSKVELQRKLFQTQNDLKRQTSKSSLNSSVNQSSNLRKGSTVQKQFSKQIQTAFNFALKAISNKQYPQARRQMLTFIQKAKKEQSHEFYIKLFEKTQLMTLEIDQLQQKLRDFQTQNIQANKNVEISNKYVRQNKWTQLQKLQIKLVQNKNNKLQLNLSLFVESVIQNNKTKTKDMQAKSKQKIPLTQSKTLGIQVQSLKKQVTTLREQLQIQRQKNTKLNQQRVKQSSQLLRLKNQQKLEKPPQQLPNLQVKKLEQKNKSLQDNRKSLEVKARSLQKTTQTQQQKISMLQKKNTSLQLSLKSKQNQLTQIKIKAQMAEKQLNQSRFKVQNIQKRQSRLSGGGQRVNVQELRALQNQFNLLSKQKQEEEYNYMKIVEQKQLKIRQLETRLQALDKISTGKNPQILRIQVEEKDKQLIKIKKQLIESLQNKSNAQSKPIQNNSETIESLINEIFEIRNKKQEQTLSKGFNLQFNNIQRQQWRQVSKKIKQYRKKYPKNKFFIYLDEKHKYEFDQTEKLTDYEQKLLAIHNGIYRIKSIVTGHQSTQKSIKGKQKQTKKWWQNIQLIHINEKTEFAKLFNQLINQIHKFYTKGGYEFRNTKHQQTEKTNQSKQKDKQKLIIVEQLKSVELVIKKVVQQLSNVQKLPKQIYSNPQFLSKQFSSLDKFTYCSSLSSSLIAFTRTISNLIKSRQLYCTKQISEQMEEIRKLNETISNRDKQLNETKHKLNELEKDKKIIQKNLQFKNKQVESKQQLKQKIFQLQQTIRKYSYYREVIQQEQKIIQYFISSINNQNQKHHKNITDATTVSKKNQNSSSTISKSIVVSQTIAEKLLTSEILTNFKKKYSETTKIVDYLEKSRLQLQQQKRKSFQTKQYLQILSAAVQQLSNNLVIQEQIDIKEKKKIFEKNNHKLQELNQFIKKKYYSSSQFQRKKVISSSNISSTNSQTDIQVNLDKLISQKINNLSKTFIQYCNKYTEINSKNQELLKRLSTIELTNEEANREVEQLVQMEKIFEYIIEKKILNAKIGSLPSLTENQATINKDPEIIRQLYLNQIKKKMKSSPYDMLKKSSMTPKSFSGNSFSNYSMKTSRIEQHHNLIIETIFKLFSKVNQLHIQYEDSIMQKFQQSRVVHVQTNQSLKQKIDNLTKALNQSKQRIKLFEGNSKKTATNQSRYTDLLGKYQSLQQNYSLIQKQKKELEFNIKKIDIFKKQLEDQRVLIEKLIGSSTSKQSINIKDIRNIELEQKKQINSFRKNYPKSKLIAYIEYYSKKNSANEIKYTSLQSQKQTIITFYQQIVQKIDKNSQSWFQNYDPKIKGNGQLISIVKQLVIQVCSTKSQLFNINSQNKELLVFNQKYLSEIKQLKQLLVSIDSLNQVIQTLQKNIQQKFNSNSKQKQQLLINQFYLKNLFDQEVRKKKIINLQPLTISISKFLHEFSLQSSIRDSKKQEQFANIKNKLTKQKQDLNQRIVQINLKNKQFEITNRQLLTQNKLIKESLKKLQSSINYLQDTKRSSQNNQKSKQYEILRLKQTIQAYVSQQTKLQLTINKLEKDKKQQERLVQKWKKQIQRLKDQIQDNHEQKMNLNKIIESLRQQHGQKQNSLEQGQALVNNLKQNYAKTEKQLHAIQMKVSTLLQQKLFLQQQITKLKIEYKKQKINQEKQLTNKKTSLQSIQKNYTKLQKDHQQLTLKIKHLQSSKQIQISHQVSIVQRLQNQIKDLTLRQKKQKDQLNKKIQTLINQKTSIIQREQKQIQKYRQKLLQMDLQKQRSKNTQSQSFHKDIDQLNKNYTNLIKNYQKEKFQLREKISKSSNDYQVVMKKTNQQKIQIINKYETQINEEKRLRLNQVKSLKDQVLGLKQQNDRLKSTVALNEKELNKLNQERYNSNLKFTQLQNQLKSIEYNLQLKQQKLTQSQKTCLRLVQYQRKSKQYETILLQNNISTSTQQNTKKSQTNLNTLQSRLKQLDSLKDKCYKLESKVQKLNLSLQKQVSEKQYIKNQAQNSRQDYIKLAAQSRQELRQLREQNKILSYQKNIAENQFSIYKENIRQLTQQNNTIEEDFRNSKLKFEREKSALKQTVQRQLNIQSHYLEKQLTEKTIKLSECESQLTRIRQKFDQLNDQYRSKQIQLIQTMSKIKEIEIKNKSQKQKLQVIYNSQKTQLKSQIQHLKNLYSKTKFDLQINTKDLNFYKVTLQQKNKQNSNLKFELQSVQNLWKLQKNNYDARIRQIQSYNDNLNMKVQESTRYQYHQRTTLQNKQNTETIYLKNQLQAKLNQLNLTQNKIANLEKYVRDREREVDTLKKFTEQIQSKLDSKMKELSNSNLLNIELDMKIKQIQRNNKFQNMEILAQLDFYKRIYSQLQNRYQNIQKEVSQTKLPFSPSSHIKIQANQKFNITINALENQNISIKKQFQSIKLRNYELQSSLTSLKSKSSSLYTTNEEMRRKQIEITQIKDQIISYKSIVQNLTSRNKELQSSKNHLKVEIQSFHSQFIKQTQQMKFQQQKYRNSQRVLDHELLQYKSKLQNIQECLKQQKQKNYAYRIQLEKIRREKFEGNTYTNEGYKLNINLQNQLQRTRIQLNQFQKRLLSKEFQVRQLQQKEFHHLSSLQNLKTEINLLKRQNQNLFQNQSQNISFINAQNAKLKQIFFTLQNHQEKIVIDEIQSKTQFDLLMRISTQIQNVVQSLSKSQKKCCQYEKQLKLFKIHQNRDLRHQQVFVYYAENMMENIQEFLIEQQIFENLHTIQEHPCNSETQKVQQYFEKIQKYLKKIILKLSKQSSGIEIIERYEWSLQNLKKLIKIYLQQGDPSAYHSLNHYASFCVKISIREKSIY